MFDNDGTVWRTLRRVREWLRPPIPPHLRARFRQLDEAAAEALRTRLIRHVFDRRQVVPDPSDEDFQNHLTGRLEASRSQIIPWLDQVRPLAGASILEIGSGTGSSTLALAEQQALVTAVEYDEHATAMARDRLRLYGLEARWIVANAEHLTRAVAGEQFDVVIFYASLEHMLHSERLAAIRATWELLPPGGLWCVVEAPNRLWYYDHHSSHLNYFNWLPDELAARYLRFSPRADARGLCGESGAVELETLARLGRGVSFHELELAIGPLASLEVVSSLALFQRRRDKTLWLRWRWSQARRYESLLASISPEVHRAFLQPDLSLVLRKPGLHGSIALICRSASASGSAL